MQRFAKVGGRCPQAVGLLGAIALSLIACSTVEPEPSTPPPTLQPLGADQEPRRLVWERYSDIHTLDPHRTTDIFSWQVFDQIYDTLLAFDQEGQLVPHLAREWRVSEDGLAVTFWLNEDIRCHDGTPFDAEDVKFTADRAMNEDNPSLTRPNWGTLTAIEVVDPLTVTFRFSEPFSAFLPFMADPFASMICNSAVDLGASFGNQFAVGTGPWEVVQWRREDELVLARNPHYVNYGRPVKNPGPPYLDQLVIRPTARAADRLESLQAGTATLITDPPLEKIDRLQEDARLRLTIADNTGQSIFFQFNMARPPFNDIRARQAVAHAIQPDVALQQVFGNLVQRERCPVARGVLGNDQDFCDRLSYTHNPDQARALLAELGYGPENPLEVTLFTWMGDRREALVTVFQEQLAGVGIQVNVEMMDISALNERVKQENQSDSGPGTFDLMGWAWYDPDILYALWHSPGAYGGYQSPELDALLAATRTTTAPEARLQAVQAVQAYLLENAVVVPIYTPGWLWVYASSANLNGLTLAPFNRPQFNDVQLTQVVSVEAASSQPASP
ncbi:MAG: ABC transporter substrate-binding protein [Synechococcales bacterium]|nr:ABC transporter substrate-binding protein [Synechococcales bacterium]